MRLTRSQRCYKSRRLMQPCPVYVSIKHLSLIITNSWNASGLFSMSVTRFTAFIPPAIWRTFHLILLAAHGVTFKSETTSLGRCHRSSCWYFCRLPARRSPPSSSRGTDGHCRDPGFPVSVGYWRASALASPRRPDCYSNAPRHTYTTDIFIPVNGDLELYFWIMNGLKMEK